MAIEHHDYTKPNKKGWTDVPPTDSEVMAFNESIMPELQPPLGIVNLGLNRLEQFLSDTIAHHYEEADVLDVGCGNGKFIISLLRNKVIGSATGLDASETMVRNARETARNAQVSATFVHGTVETMCFDMVFDVIVANEILEHLYSPYSALQRLSSLLQKQGLLCGSVPFHDTCDCGAHLQHFIPRSLKHLLKRFFLCVGASVVDLTGTGERHIKFTASLPIKCQGAT